MSTTVQGPEESETQPPSAPVNEDNGFAPHGQPGHHHEAILDAPHPEDEDDLSHNKWAISLAVIFGVLK